MRPAPARILLSLLAATATGLALLTRQPWLFVIAAGALVFLGTSLATSRLPLTRSFEAFVGRHVDLLLWSAPPPEAAGGELVLTSVNRIGAGVHLFFRNSAGRLMHLKIAQPDNPLLATDRVVIRDARYVQWNGAKIAKVAGADAAAISLER